MRQINDHRPVRYSGRIALVACAMSMFVATAPAAAIELTPHRAIYELRLASFRGAGNIVDADGAVSLEWSESCDGWTVDQRFRLALSFEGRDEVETLITFSSFEDKAGRSYRFNSKTTRNGRVTDRFRGVVERPGADVASVAKYSEPRSTEVRLPAGTLFPMHHTRRLLEAAAAGEPRFDAGFFEGPRPEDSPFTANALILSGPFAAEDGAAGAYGEPIDRPWWRMRLAFFTQGGNDLEPDFELGIDLQEDGIAQDLVFDYPEFSLSGTLIVAERLDRPDCP